MRNLALLNKLEFKINIDRFSVICYGTKVKKPTPNNILALSHKEKVILATLSGPSSAASLTMSTDLPRTTVVRTIAKLHSRGLISPQKSGGRTLWKKTEDKIVSDNLVSSASKIGVNLDSINSPDFCLVTGAQNIATDFAHALELLPRSGQFNGIQTSVGALKSLDKVGVENVAKINALIKKKGLIVRGVVSKDGAQKMYSHFGDVWLNSFRDRTAHFVTVPDKYLIFETDLYIIGEKVFLIDWEKESALVITNPNFYSLINSLYLYLFESGERIDYHLALAKQ